MVDYHNLAAVKQAIPNGQLCAGGDSEKSGMDTPSMHWQRTDVTPDNNGQVSIIFDAHTPITRVSGSFICLMRPLMLQMRCSAGRSWS